ncbi:hypothetical protein D7X30_00165 [Corallococcus sp. AB011P]|uniref:hypothetical protein n=1 Tax=unclassified Corallococcus TaxID=2685029 RepID=UPI000EA072B0|nr:MULTISPECIES: hypothetical protein [unclassified Corallococcus]RKG61800.1 hypothetical protein D7X30_00165 [Corallococcus sp. AB011P]RKH90277.1 hypothetical protein D7Y21_07130 [Corallococcus sp. AB045]
MTLSHSRPLLLGAAMLMACASSKPSVASAPAATSQSLSTPKARVLAEPDWAGSYVIQLRSKGTWIQGDKRFDWSDTMRFGGILRVHMDATRGEGQGTAQHGFVNLSRISKMTDGTQVTEEVDGSCAHNVLLPVPTEPLSFPTDDTFLFRAVVSQAEHFRCGAFRKVAGGETQRTKVAAPPFPSLPPALFTFPLPTGGKPQLLGRLRFVTIGDKVVQERPTELRWGETPIEWEIDWDLRPEDTGGAFLKLQPESSEDYDNWLPMGPKLEPAPKP